MRGVDLKLTPAQVLDRIQASTSVGAPLIQYMDASGRNGGSRPGADDCGTRWERSGKTVATSDCVGYYCWLRGIDRYQPDRFAHIYAGWMNTDSIIQDATGPAKCWRVAPRPYPTCAVVYPSTFLAGVRLRMGHIAAVLSVPAEYAPQEPDWWARLRVAECHGPRMAGMAIRTRDGSIWRKRGIFVEWVG